MIDKEMVIILYRWFLLREVELKIISGVIWFGGKQYNRWAPLGPYQKELRPFVVNK